MENLLALVEKIQQLSPLNVFSKEVFIVQNAGMQHWLNMSLAEQRGISLNIDYALPAQFLWNLVRSLVNGQEESEQSPFSREAMSWRIYQILAKKEVCRDKVFQPVTQYWLNAEGDANQNSNIIFNSQQNLKRYNLSCQLADLFEQYLVFRPDWIDVWKSGRLVKDTPSFTDINGVNFEHNEQWQAKLWCLLTQEQDYNPLNLLTKATANLSENLPYIPKRLCFFGINAMAPMWLSFINALSDVTEVHFFHLNPCVDYWGDISSEKQLMKNNEKWLQEPDSLSQAIGNPLLANFGQQGREFLVLLQQYATVNIEAFQSTVIDGSKTDLSILNSLQDDILSLRDGRIQPKKIQDDSIIISSAHSALREVQGLHDWLLHQFNQDSDLTPKDVLVMCPQVEQYAPYVNAVFTRGWQDLASDIPPLPCSISDRISKDSEPLVIAFSELLNLPDNRFHVSQVLAWLRLPAMQNKFSLQLEDIEKITVWIENACIHWGIDHSHKKQVLHTDNVGEQFTWQYGFSRLLQGFAYSDQNSLYQGKSLIADVEGSDSILLGHLMLILEQLQHFTLQLNKARNANQWHQFLLSLIDDLFDVETDDSFHNIFSAIDSLVEYCEHASFTEEIELNVIREFLNNHFSQPDPGRQFMVGQVTFCSMIPMRSIPFKIVAILGLNDGEYPRQRTSLGFDLMSMSKPRVGDRSRRGDDRYLFLEAIISARQSLYLSYQGRSIQNNKERQPSIVLKELMDYLSQAYHWQLLSADKKDIRQLAMQAYSEKNYQGKYPGFDKKWFRLSPLIKTNSEEIHKELIIESSDVESNKPIELHLHSIDLIKFYQHPARSFAQNKLSLFLDSSTNQLKDNEPFESDHLTRYLFKEQVLENVLEQVENNNIDFDQDNIKTVLTTLNQQAKLSGKFPQLPNSDQQLNKLIDDSLKLVEFVWSNKANKTKEVTLEVSFDIKQVSPQDSNIYRIRLSTTVNVVENKIIHYRSSLPKAKDFFSLYLHLLIVQVWQQEPSKLSLMEELEGINTSHGYYFDSKSQKTVHYYYNNFSDAKNKLVDLVKLYILGQHKALLLNGDLAHYCFNKLNQNKPFEQIQFEKFWHDDSNLSAFGNDPYISYFWPTCPKFSNVLPLLTQVYQSVTNDCQQAK